MSHQSTPNMCQVGHEKFVLNCCLVAMVINHVSNLQYISLQINVPYCYGDCLFELWFISYSLVRSAFYDCLICYCPMLSMQTTKTAVCLLFSSPSWVLISVLAQFHDLYFTRNSN